LKHARARHNRPLPHAALGSRARASYVGAMTTATAEHYDQLLADRYSWMLGDFEARVERERGFLAAHGVVAAHGVGAPHGAEVAVDLGAGSGHQAVALARLGWRVRAIDFSARLLAELRTRTAGLSVDAIQDDLRRFPAHLSAPAGAIVCLGDTLTHLASPDDVQALFADARAWLRPGGALVLTFRDLSRALEGPARFIPVRSDADTILTCFLEYLPATVRVHDLLYRREGDAWRLTAGAYDKLRLAPADVERWLAAAGFVLAHSAAARGLVEIVARVPSGNAG
jgi:SAM-dependent methyltransferase